MYSEPHLVTVSASRLPNYNDHTLGTGFQYCLPKFKPDDEIASILRHINLVPNMVLK